MKKYLIALLLLPALARAEFTQPQKDNLKAAIQAESSITSCYINGDHGCIATWLNSDSTFIVWRTAVSQADYQTKVSSEGTTFNWSGTGGFIARSQGERDAWRTMFATGSVNPSLTNVIAAFNDIFSGTGAGAVANRAHLAATSKRNATFAEKTLSTGTGTSASPGVLTFEGLINVNDIPGILGN
jgi:hypothetical protein